MGKKQKQKRPLIAARERGPGPGRYKLPSCVGNKGADATKRTMPAFSFGKRLENPMFRKDSSPGPCYSLPPAITRFGKVGTPSYSMLGRAKSPNTFKTPGPGAYHPEKSHPQREKHAPAYSMGSRTRYRKKDNTPSPNSYTLPPLLGPKVPTKASVPSYSMAGRADTGSFSEDLAKSPGPGRYNIVPPDVYSKRSPAYSMLSRSYLPEKSTNNPGPGAYTPEKVTMNKPSAPKFSMGIRHSEYISPLIFDIRDKPDIVD